MGLREALLKFKADNENAKNDAKIAEMLAEQQKILNGDKPKPKTWDSSILSKGGISTYKTNILKDGLVKKRTFKISVTNSENDVVLKFHTRIANGERLSVNAKSYKEAQTVVDELMGKGMYSVSGSVV